MKILSETCLQILVSDRLLTDVLMALCHLQEFER